MLPAMQASSSMPALEPTVGGPVGRFLKLQFPCISPQNTYHFFYIFSIWKKKISAANEPSIFYIGFCEKNGKYVFQKLYVSV
jgi:hypothetical protein